MESKELATKMLKTAPRQVLEATVMPLSNAFVLSKEDTDFRNSIPDAAPDVTIDIFGAVALNLLEQKMTNKKPTEEQLASVEQSVADLLNKVKGVAK